MFTNPEPPSVTPRGGRGCERAGDCAGRRATLAGDGARLAHA